MEHGLRLLTLTALLALPLVSASLPPHPARAQDGAIAAPEAEGLEARVRAAVEAEFERQGLVGLSVAVVDGDEAHEIHLGHADVVAKVPAGPKTMYRWASISKPVTAIRAAQLARDGALDLDSDVRTLVPEFPEKPWPITTRQLLGHLGGVVHYNNGEVIRTERDYDVEHPFADVVVALDRFAASPLVAEPGTKYSYSTHGYILASAAVQRAGDAPFWEQVREHVAAPLGMHTFRPDYQWEDIPGRALGYRRVGKAIFPSTDTDVTWKLGGGGFISTVGDLARFGRGLCGEALLSREELDALWTPLETRDGKPTGYGLGFGVKRIGERLRIGHSGSQEKARTLLQVFPDEGRVVAVMTNSEFANVGEIGQAVWKAVER